MKRGQRSSAGPEAVPNQPMTGTSLGSSDPTELEQRVANNSEENLPRREADLGGRPQ